MELDNQRSIESERGLVEVERISDEVNQNLGTESDAHHHKHKIRRDVLFSEGFDKVGIQIDDGIEGVKRVDPRQHEEYPFLS